ncbi:GNAT family N-acetyltransferase [Sulfurovum sp. CS9]|uniref:GNAT family N-acetyltransferase n=1 Tax=Sulfurovum sp. CS9 TaxID=3391146 RepID=UPI0039E8D413
MHESIVLKIPSNIQCMEIVKDVIKNTCKTLPLTQDDIQALLYSTEELIHNAVTHAYKDERGYIEMTLHPFKTGLRIDVHDWGIPMSHKKHKSVPIDKEASAGFNRIYNLVDTFEYHNLGKEGKKFVIIKYASYPLHAQKNLTTQTSVSSEKEEKEVSDPNIPITIREFREGDEEGVAYLIYKNYGHSYIKDLFYYPQKILEYHGKEFYSVVAESDGRIIGHFAFILIPESTIAEIGIVVVDPLFKGRGIMNRMLELVLKKAKEIGLDAVFGEAIMYHTYSQKSNLRHGFGESAMMLGKTLADVTLENIELTKKYERGSVLVGYRFFHKITKSLYLPKVYKDQIKLTYLNAEVSFVEKKNKEKNKVPEHVFLTYQFDPPSNIAMIRVDYYAKDFKQKFLRLVSQLRAKHCDMIYADVSLEKIPQINKVIKIMNKRGFFYSGVMFFYHEKEDYLRLQLKHSDKIGSKNYVCYSDFCKRLSKYILKDEKRIKK